MQRGVFIVFEGLDRSGKSTQIKKLKEKLKKKKISFIVLNFPERSTSIGKIINSYLKNDINCSDQTIHLLFSANRWEEQKFIKKTLEKGTSIICSRYCYSGISYTAAKGLNYQWCKSPDNGIIEPDITFFFNFSPTELSKREGFGKERYEELEFQKKVSYYFQKIFKEPDNKKNIITIKKNNDLNYEDEIERTHLFIFDEISKRYNNFKTNTPIMKMK